MPDHVTRDTTADIYQSTILISTLPTLIEAQARSIIREKNANPIVCVVSIPRANTLARNTRHDNWYICVSHNRITGHIGYGYLW